MAENIIEEGSSVAPTAGTIGWISDVLAKPIHIQRVEEALRLEPLLSYIEALNKQPINRLGSDEDKIDIPILPAPSISIQRTKRPDGSHVYNGTTVITKKERQEDKCRLYNFEHVKKSRKWLKSALLSDSSSDDDDDEAPLTDADLTEMLKQHLLEKKFRLQYAKDKELRQYQYYSVGLLSNYDKFYEHQKAVVGPRKKAIKDKQKTEKKVMQQKLQQLIESTSDIGPSQYVKEEELSDGESHEAATFKTTSSTPTVRGAGGSSGIGVKTKTRKVTEEQMATRRHRLFVMIAKKEIPRAQKQMAAQRKEGLQNVKKLVRECQKEVRKYALVSQKAMKEAALKARRLSKEMLLYWRRFDKVEKEQRRKAEKEAIEQRKIDVELREMKRQQRKLNFLITQTELYAHFMARKLTGGTDADRDAILGQLEESKQAQRRLPDGRIVKDTAEDNYDANEVKAIALSNAEDAYQKHQNKNRRFDEETRGRRSSSDQYDGSVFANPSINSDVERSQPQMFQGLLKSYQLKGMNWLANLYDQGINGILADEMGLGKTVQSIAFFAHLAEALSIWGPFLIIAPASTLHNWQQEVARFVPRFKIVPYWGNTQDRRVLRKFWNQDSVHTEESSFHVVITSYQIVVTDVKYFQRIKWHYMILDEAQAIKSSTSARWKVLLSFNCRNRLLLSGTPIQNSMAELWALLHFIMPTLFDSHEEFNEWFSKDIESHVEKQSSLDESQLGRLHMILKPFMLRRIKKDVENELSDKIEILLYCPLTRQQRLLYQAIKNKISIEDLLQSATGLASSRSASSASLSAGAGGTSGSGSATATNSLMNLVMQFRKVCNHPELFERRENHSPFYMRLEPYRIPKLIYREGLLEESIPSKRHLLLNKFFILNSANVSRSLFPQQQEACSAGQSVDSCFSFTRLINMSPGELENIMLGGLCARWISLVDWLRRSYVLHHRRDYHIEAVSTSHTGCVYTNTSHKVGRRVKMFGHRKRILRACPVLYVTQKDQEVTTSTSELSTAPLALNPNTSTAVADQTDSPDDESVGVLDCVPTDMPEFLYYTIPKACARCMDRYTSDRSAEWQRVSDSLCGTVEALSCLLYGEPDGYKPLCHPQRFFFPSPPHGLAAIQPAHGFSRVQIPDKETLITDAGKMFVLDELLLRLKSDGHRVLIYSQMTRMIDILEEFLWHRQHKYMRLDGSSKISDRRDMVADFQTRSDIFVFLLSTRAGGLGINLTAADTVIFYDSDWNPTVDQQAMDRAHRLGQTKQVTVYRLVCKGTIEERILQRAKEKSNIQQMVISGGNFAPDILKPKEVVSLLLDDDEMERRLSQKQDEKKIKEEISREKDRARKRKQSSALTSKSSELPRGPGRPLSKKTKFDEKSETAASEDVTSLSCIDESSVISYSSFTRSGTTSPHSEVSAASEAVVRWQTSSLIDDESCDELVIVDDTCRTTASPGSGISALSTSIKRGRGNPKFSPGVGVKSKGSAVRKSLSCVEMAGVKSPTSAPTTGWGLTNTTSDIVSEARVPVHGHGTRASRSSTTVGAKRTLTNPDVNKIPLSPPKKKRT